MSRKFLLPSLLSLALLGTSVQALAYSTKDGALYDNSGTQFNIDGVNWAGFQDSGFIDEVYGAVPFYAIPDGNTKSAFGLMDMLTQPQNVTGSGVETSTGKPSVAFKTIRLPITPANLTSTNINTGFLKNLTSRSLRIENAAGRRGTDDFRNPDNAEFFVDADLGKNRRMGIADVFSRLHDTRADLAILDDLVRTRNMGLIFISHDLNLVSSFCDRVLVMYAGQIMEELDARNLHEAKHPYTKGLLACLPELGHPVAKLPTLIRDEAWKTALPVKAATR